MAKEQYWDKARGEYRWREAKPVPYQGWKARLEHWLRAKGMKRLANLMAVWDERGLG